MSEKEFIYNTSSLVSEQKPQFVSYELVDPKNPILTTKVPDFDFNDETLNPTEIASRLVETATTFKTFGLSANQCGLPYKICVVGNEDEYVAFFNPELISVSDELVLLPESDLSNLGLILHVKRPKSIVIKYTTFEKDTVTQQFDGITARVIQQHIDRLNGVDFKSRVSNLSLKRKQKSLDKKVKRFVRSNIVTG